MKKLLNIPEPLAQAIQAIHLERGGHLTGVIVALLWDGVRAWQRRTGGPDGTEI